MTVEEFYQSCFNKILEHNKNNAWGNPIFIPDYNSTLDHRFVIQLDCFIEIEWPNTIYKIIVYKITHIQELTKIFCKVVL
jgi:hypothetical protein